eukprot:4586869-Heterocapsa_arctica.AAC.1
MWAELQVLGKAGREQEARPDLAISKAAPTSSGPRDWGPPDPARSVLFYQLQVPRRSPNRSRDPNARDERRRALRWRRCGS